MSPASVRPDDRGDPTGPLPVVEHPPVKVETKPTRPEDWLALFIAGVVVIGAGGFLGAALIIPLLFDVEQVPGADQIIGIFENALLIGLGGVLGRKSDDLRRKP